MSLDFWLSSETYRLVDEGPKIFIRRNGQTVEIDRAEWDRLYPGQEPVTFAAEPETNEVFSANITHNLGKMADEAGLYDCLWRPDENGIRVASEMIFFLEDGIAKLRANPDHYRQFNASNGWGKYENLLSFAEGVLAACREHPDARVSTWR